MCGMSWAGAGGPIDEGKALLRSGVGRASASSWGAGSRAAAEGCDHDEPLLWTSCDGLFDQGVSRTYPTIVPWDALGVVLLMGLCASGLAAAPFVLLRAVPLFKLLLPAGLLQALPEIFWIAIFGIVGGVLVVLGQIPTRVVRQPDAFVVEFLLRRHVVPLKDVLELVVLHNGRGGRFGSLLQRWGVFPFGWSVRFFCGVPSSNGVVCVLLTARCFWSFVFCIKDPIPFILDNQRPLDLRARYRTAHAVLLRQGESLESQKVAIVPRGHLLRVDKQHGRRVLVQFEKSQIGGWMSHISSIGTFLLTKERGCGRGAGRGAPVPGALGASELHGSYGSAVELGVASAALQDGVE